MPVPVAPQMSGGTPGVLPRNPAGHTWSTAASSPKGRRQDLSVGTIKAVKP